MLCVQQMITIYLVAHEDFDFTALNSLGIINGIGAIDGDPQYSYVSPWRTIRKCTCTTVCKITFWNLFFSIFDCYHILRLKKPFLFEI